VKQNAFGLQPGKVDPHRLSSLKGSQNAPLSELSVDAEAIANVGQPLLAVQPDGVFAREDSQEWLSHNPLASAA